MVPRGMNEIQSVGWFYWYRGNAYGPCPLRRDAEASHNTRALNDGFRFALPSDFKAFHGMAIVRERKLVKFTPSRWQVDHLAGMTDDEKLAKWYRKTQGKEFAKVNKG